MNILLVQRFDLSSVSCTRRVLSQARELAARGHEVTLVDFPHPERRALISSPQQLGLEGIRIIRLSRRAIDVAANCRRLATLTPRPDIVHLWKSYPDAALPALVAADRAGAPLHYDWDDWEPAIAAELTGSRLAAHVAGRWDRAMARVCDTCSVASSELKRIALDWGVQPERIWDAPVGADTTLFHPCPPDPSVLQRIDGPEPPVLVYVGQLEVAVYADVAVDVLAYLSGEGVSARLLIVGGGRYEEHLRRHAERRGVEDSVLCTGYVSGSDIWKYLSVATVALAPFADTLVARCKSPLKIAEYLAMGLPIVASDVGDSAVMIEGAGFAVPPEDTKAMADCVEEILSDQDMRTRFSAAARRKAEERYNWSWHTTQLEAAYYKATG
ncbi:MAG: glycosyltransferase family 4 protein [bacterium]